MVPASRSSSLITGDKSTFKISMVDDEVDSMGNELAEIEDYLEKRGLELKIDKYENAEKAANIDPATDIAFIDKNLNGDSGIDVVGNIRKRHKLLDILVYSRRGIRDEDLRRLNIYGTVEVVQKKDQVIYRLRNLVRKNLSKWSDIVYMRGTVISRLIDIEQEVNDVLMDVFLPSEPEKFRHLVLEQSIIMSMDAKKTILSKIMKGMENKPFNVKDLEKLQNYRNTLAHCRRSEKDPNILIKGGTGKPIGRDEIKRIFETANKFSECLCAFRSGVNTKSGVSHR